MEGDKQIHAPPWHACCLRVVGTINCHTMCSA